MVPFHFLVFIILFRLLSCYLSSISSLLLELSSPDPSPNLSILPAGDFNVAHTPLDLAQPDYHDGRSGFSQLERDGFRRILTLDEEGSEEDGERKVELVDSFRFVNGNIDQCYTYWEYAFAYYFPCLFLLSLSLPLPPPFFFPHSSVVIAFELAQEMSDGESTTFLSILFSHLPFGRRKFMARWKGLIIVL